MSGTDREPTDAINDTDREGCLVKLWKWVSGKGKDTNEAEKPNLNSNISRKEVREGDTNVKIVMYIDRWVLVLLKVCQPNIFRRYDEYTLPETHSDQLKQTINGERPSLILIQNPDFA
ncbi:MAG: hypothetical protein IPP46_15140 [Bacteroidetes bacterium]|nr:hypothetical protein [Bacteroidota bacterium]